MLRRQLYHHSSSSGITSGNIATKLTRNNNPFSSSSISLLQNSIRTRFGTPLHEPASPKSNPSHYGFGGTTAGNSNNRNQQQHEKLDENEEVEILNEDGTMTRKSTGPQKQREEHQNNVLGSDGFGDPTLRPAPLLFMTDSDKPQKSPIHGKMYEKGKRAPRRKNPSVLPPLVGFVIFMYVMYMITYGGDFRTEKKVVNGRLY